MEHMDGSLFERLADRRLTWLPDLGVGFYDVRASVSAISIASYFAKYLGYRDTELGRRLTQCRVDLVDRHWAGPVVDVGIGAGAFVEARPRTRGYRH